jgi:hypothetical protein
VTGATYILPYIKRTNGMVVHYSLKESCLPSLANHKRHHSACLMGSKF